jgi:site-specific DNA recombinase
VPRLLGLTEADVRQALHRLDPLWDELFPTEQARIVQLLVQRVDIRLDGADIRLRTEGLTKLVADRSQARTQEGGIRVRLNSLTMAAR